MNMRIALTSATVALGLSIGGCARTAPILNLEAMPVTTTSGAALTQAQVRSAIIAGGTSLGWSLGDAGPGRVQGRLDLRAHTAVVDIAYSATSYSIIYKSSINLNESGGTIHSNYNGWVQHLDRAIRTEIARL